MPIFNCRSEQTIRCCITILLLTLLLNLQACALVVVGAAAGVATAADRRSAGAIVDDEGIELKALDKINGDASLRDLVHVNVTSYNYIVLLTGEALNPRARQIVSELVRNLPKVKRVHNELVVSPLTSFKSRSNDTWITSKVKAKLLATKDLGPTLVKVVTENSVVFLIGIVTEKEARLATEATRYVDGVKRVVRLFEYITLPETKPVQYTNPGSTSR